MRHVGIPEWIIRTVQAMYMYLNMKGKVRIRNCFSKNFGIKVGVYQGSVISPHLFVIVLEALAHDFSVGAPCKLFYADDLMITAKTLNKLTDMFLMWKSSLELRGLRVSMKKTKIMISDPNLDSKENFPHTSSSL